MKLPFIYDDGGRTEAGFKGSTGDCVVRALAIVSQRPYLEVYDVCSAGVRTQRLMRGERRSASARDGVNTRRKWFSDLMASWGFVWTPTMQIGSGCKVHLREGELPSGRLMVNVSRHYVAVVDGVMRDIYDPSRGGMRCVYGYWSLR